MNMKASVGVGNWETKVILREQMKLLKDFVCLFCALNFKNV